MSLFMGFQPLDEGVATQGRRSERDVLTQSSIAVKMLGESN